MDLPDPTSKNLNILHTTYCRLTSGTANLKVWEADWFAFSQAGYGEDDLRCYLEYLKRENRRMNGAAYSLALHKILDREFKYFDSILSLARASERNRRPAKTPSEQVREQFSPVVGESMPPPNIVPMKELLKKVVNEL